MTAGEIGLGLALALDYAIVLALIPRIVAQRREAQATLAWVFFVLLVPYLGLIAFWAMRSIDEHNLEVLITLALACDCCVFESFAQLPDFVLQCRLESGTVSRPVPGLSH